MRRRDSTTGKRAIIIDSGDNVATSLADLKAGETVHVDGNTIRLSAPVPFGHKFSLRTIEAGAAVIKYGQTIGTASTRILPGEHVHIHNVVSTRGRGDLRGTA